MIINLDNKFEDKSQAFLDIEKWQFPAGEIGIKIPEPVGIHKNILIKTRLKNSESIIELLMVTDATRRRFPDADISVYFPYMPYARQDRCMVPGEAFSLKVFANLINSQNYKKVICLEPHSDVGPALINNFEPAIQYYLLSARDKINKEFGENWTVISPDGGALKRIYKQIDWMNIHPEVVEASKKRDVTNGKIIGIKIDSDDNVKIKDKVCVIFDDILSRGNSFIYLAKKLKEMGAANIVLVVAHDEGVADEKVLQESGIDRVITTNSIRDNETELTKIIRLDP